MDVEETEFGSRLINVDVMSSTELQRKKIKQAQLKILEANQKVRDLSINIRWVQKTKWAQLVKSGSPATNLETSPSNRASQEGQIKSAQNLLGGNH